MPTKLRLVLGAALVTMLLGIVYLVGGPESEDGLTPPVVAAGPDEPDPAALHGLADDGAEVAEAGARVPVVEEASPPPLDPLVVTEDSVPYALEIRVVDHHGISVEDAEVFGAPRGVPLNRLGRTGSDGRLTARWYGRGAGMEFMWSVRHSGRSSSLFRTHVAGGQTHRVLIPIEANVLLIRRSGGEFVLISGAFVTNLASTRPRDEVPRVARRASGEIGFLDPLQWGSEIAAPGVVAMQTSGTLRLNISGASFELAGSIVIDAEEPPPPEATLSGVVRNAAGEPLGGVPVVIGPGEEKVSWRGETDGEGRFLFEGLTPRTLHVRAGGGPFGLAHLQIEVSAGEEATWDATLDRGLVTQGRLSTAEGAPLTGWRVELSARDSFDPWCAVVKTRTDGGFAIPNCPAGALRLEGFAPDQSHLPTLVVDGVRAGEDTRDYVLANADRIPSAAFVEVRNAGSPEGEVMPWAEVRLWQAASDRGTVFSPAGESGRHHVQNVPPGPYDVEVGAARRGWIDNGPFFVTLGDTATDLGVFHLPQAGAEWGVLDLRCDPPHPWTSGTLHVSLHRRDPDVVVEVLTMNGMSTDPPLWPGDLHLLLTGQGSELDLPPGDYILRLHHAEHGTREFAFSLAPAGSVTLAVTLDERGIEVEARAPDAAGD